MTLTQKLGRIKRLLNVLQRLEGQTANAVSNFSHSNAVLNQVHNDSESIYRRARRNVAETATVLLEEIEKPNSSQWNQTVEALRLLGVTDNFNSIGTARHVFASIMSYITYLNLKSQYESSGDPFPNCWVEPLNQLAQRFSAVIAD